jgi:8-oxo-dGTP diphosphatase
MICLLKPLNHDIVRETEEIAEALWMDIDEYLSHEHVHALNKEIVRAALSGHHLYKKDVEGYPVDKNEYEIFLP